MHVVIRTYYGKGAKKFIDLLEQHLAEVQRLMRSIDGFVGYTLARTAEGGFSVTICQDERGIKQSVKTAREFIAKHAPEMSIAAMHISEGTVVTHIR